MSLLSRGTDLIARTPGGPDGRRVLAVSFVDKVGTGLWTTAAVLYFSTVAGLGIAQVGTLIAVSSGIGMAGAPLAGRLADRMPLLRLLTLLQLARTAAALALLTSREFWPLLAYSALGSLADRGSNVTGKLYAARISGPDRVRFQAINRTAMNLGYAAGGLAAAGALAVGTLTAYRVLLIGDALSYLGMALIYLRCAEPAGPSRVVTAGSTGAGPAAAPADAPRSPWRDRTYLLFALTEAVLFLDDAIFKVGIPLWVVHTTDAPPGLVPLLMVLNNVLVVCFQVPLARFGTTAPAARGLLRPLAACYALGCLAMTASAYGGTWTAAVFLTLAATALTLAEMLHATASWELSLALAPEHSQGAYLGVHGLASSAQRSAGPLVVTVAVAAGPLAWAAVGAALALTSFGQHRLVGPRTTPRTAPDAPGPVTMSVPPVTVSEH
ncbi:MFS transporter [Streptomyces sp. NPDC089919]|uniref:MFS transporter n=1 Tax=Streptomyces sp. NPDC089919 TaxID=3155188 RepID=UPI00341737AF